MSPEMFLQVADLFPDAAILLTRDGVILAASRRTAALGLPPHDLASRAFADFTTTPNDALGDFLRLCYRSREPVTGSLVLRAGGGREVACRCYGAVIDHGPDGAQGQLLLRLVPRDAAPSQFAVLNQKLDELTREVHRRKQAEEELHRAVARHRTMEEHLTTLVEASATLTSTLDPPTVLASILQLIERLLPADAHAVWRLHTPSGQWHIACSSGLSAAYREGTIRILQQTPQMPDQPVVAEDVFDSPFLSMRRDAYLAEGIRSLLAVPLRIEGNVCGTLAIYHRQPYRFSDIEIGVATAVANLAAAAIGSADLYEEQARLRAVAQEHRERLRVTLASIGDAVIATDTEGRVTFLNPVAEALTGWPSAEAQGRPLEEVFAIVNEETLRTVENPVAKALRDGRVVGLANHTLLVARDGTHRPIDDSAAPIRDHEGNVVGVVLVFRDNSERRRAERFRVARLAITQALAQADSALEAAGGILEAVCANLGWDVGAFWEAGAGGEEARCLAVRPGSSPAAGEFEALTRRIRFRRGEGLPGRVLATGRPAWIADVTADLNFPRAPVAAQAGLHGAFACPVSHDDTVLGIVEFFSPEIREPDADLLEMVTTLGGQMGLFLQRLRAEAVLRRSEQDTRFLAAASAELAALVDYQSTLQKVAQLAVPTFADWCSVDMLDDAGTLRRLAVAHVDPSKVELAHELHRRYPPSPDAPSGVWSILRTGEAEMVPEISDDLIAARVEDPELLKIIRALGLRSYMGVPLAVRDRVLGVITFIAAESGRIYDADDLAVAEDLAHRAGVAIENARLYQAAREADRRKDEFLALLGHELRNPLAPISNALNVLKLPGADAAITRRAREMMERQVEYMIRLVDDLLDVSRIMRGKVELRREPVELAAVVARAVETSQPAIDAEGHGLTVELPPEPLWVHGDVVRLAQVLSNLLNNAAKYTEPGGRIALTASREGAEGVLRVRDTGIGIAPDLLPRLFDMFFQAERRTKESQGGLGIGLSLVRGLVELHGGTVEAHSDGRGHGSEFVVRLPLLVRQETDTERGNQQDARAGRSAVPRRVLVVDDNVDAADSMAMLLRLGGHEVRVAYDGASGLETAQAARPDIAFLDLGMPRMDGYELARAFRANPDLRGVVLVALTGWGQPEDRQRTREAGFDHHLVKPVEAEELAELLEGCG